MDAQRLGKVKSLAQGVGAGRARTHISLHRAVHFSLDTCLWGAREDCREEESLQLMGSEVVPLILPGPTLSCVCLVANHF
jgi:hypothetical protein